MNKKFLITILFLLALSPVSSQTIVGRAAGDFYSVFAKLTTGIERQQLHSLEDLGPYINSDVHEMLEDNLVYRVAFIGYAANQYGIITGITSSVGFAETLNALTGFIMIIEEDGRIREWTISEIIAQYEYLFSTSWRNVNNPLFVVMLEAYCSYKRGELW